MQPTSGLVANHLVKNFSKRPVVNDISLYIQRGEAVGLLGPNGAGKTTTFSMIAGLYKPSNGTITLDDHDITTLPMYRRARLGIGYLPQEPSIFRGLSVEQNIRAVVELYHSDIDTIDDIVEELLSEFMISGIRASSALTLSGGERRRVEIARAIASQPHFILLDEPLAGIDPIAVQDIKNLIVHLKERGIGVLITDHNVRETLSMVDRAYIMSDGQLLMTGTPDEIIKDETVRSIYLGNTFSH